MFDLDTVIDRKNTLCLKYDFAAERGKPADVLPFWVADMDFKVAPCITDALEKQVRHGIFGYSEAKKPYFDALRRWFSAYFQWDVQEDWLIKTPGVVPAINVAIQAFTQPGDAVLIQSPVYYPFAASIRNNGRRVADFPLVRRNGRYVMGDFNEMERIIEEEGVKLALFCSPQNPTGRVWTKEEISRFSRVCRRHHVIVVADEIHCDFTYPGYAHTAFGTIGEEDAQNAVICTAPSKTFNIAGLQNSNIWIPNPRLREAFRQGLDRFGYDQLNVMGLVAAQAAYEGGREWLDEVKRYIRQNLNYLRQFLADNLPHIHVVEPEGTYLVFLDCRDYGLTDAELESVLLDKAHLWVDMGYIFGAGGSGHFRLNLACPRETLAQGLEQLRQAFAPLPAASGRNQSHRLDRPRQR